MALIDENTSKNITERKGSIKRFFPKESDQIFKERIEQRLAVAQPLFNMGFKDANIGIRGRELLKKDIITTVLLEMLFGKGSDLYERLYREGLINDSFVFDFIAEVDYSYSMLGGESPDPDRLFGLIREYVSGMKPETLGEKDFKLARNKLLGRYLRNFDNLEYIASNFVSYHFKGANFLSFVELLGDIELESLRERFEEHIRHSTPVLSLITPK
jgi:predicted Zn-dependent peptidase